MRSETILAAGVLVLASLPAAAQRSEAVVSRGNPILADGRYYSTDPAPLVDGDTLWILAGRDEAPADVNDFIMNEWQLLATTDPASGLWRHYPAIARPEAVFGWAEPGRAYAGQIVKGADGRFYLYAPVLQRGEGPVRDRRRGRRPAHGPMDRRPPRRADRVADDPAGERHPEHRPDRASRRRRAGVPLLGTFGKLRAIELERDMVTPKGTQVPVTGVDGFFEAPWLAKRKGVYYLLYAANNAGPTSTCTPAVYHACIAYSTAPTAMGPWTYRGVVLRPVSSTTSHPGLIDFKGQWYLAYHTADAAGGGHFRRSVALDKVMWDDSVTPARIRPVVPTRLPQPTPAPTRNIAGAAVAAASNEPIPVQYWIKALNDGIVKAKPLPPEMWGNWTGRMPAESWIEYRWATPVRIDGSRMWFFADRPAGSGVGVAPPKRWRIDYWDDRAKDWRSVADASGYDTRPGLYQDTRFSPVTTRCLRATFEASQGGGSHAAVAVQEWQVLAPTAKWPIPPAEGRVIAPCG